MDWDAATPRRYTPFAAVALGHVLFVMLLLRLDFSPTLRLEHDTSPILLLDLSSSANPTARTFDASQAARPRTNSPKSPGAEISVGVNAPYDAGAAASPDALTVEPPVDWREVAEQVAKSQAKSIFKELKHQCNEAALRGEFLPECRKYKKSDAWVPVPRTFGIAGGLPYVRLGKRCIIGLGFFGCAVGKGPDANGRLFDDMREPDRPQSFVPTP